MYLLIVRAGEGVQNKQLTTGQIEKKDGSKKEFAVIPGAAQKLDFEYGDKVVCVHGTFLMLIHPDSDKQVAGIQMHDRYWLPNHEVTITEDFMDRQKTELYKLPLTGVNHRVNGGRVVR